MERGPGERGRTAGGAPEGSTRERRGREVRWGTEERERMGAGTPLQLLNQIDATDSRAESMPTTGTV